jgi:hypothetical protein
MGKARVLFYLMRELTGLIEVMDSQIAKLFGMDGLNVALLLLLKLLYLFFLDYPDISEPD